MVNRAPITVIKENNAVNDETKHCKEEDSLLPTPISTPGRRRSSTLTQIFIDLNPISRSQKVEYYVINVLTK